MCFEDWSGSGDTKRWKHKACLGLTLCHPPSLPPSKSISSSQASLVRAYSTAGRSTEDITNQWADEAELLMLTEWNTAGVQRWSTGSNLGQRPRRDTKMQTHAHIYISLFTLFVSSFCSSSVPILSYANCAYSIKGKVYSEICLLTMSYEIMRDFPFILICLNTVS